MARVPLNVLPQSGFSCRLASSDVAVVLFGPTQAGKSTTFKWLSGCPHSETSGASGTASGESVTVEPKLNESKVGLLLDTPGINDTKMRFTNQEAGKKIAVAVLQHGVTKLKIAVFEGLANDAMKLRHTLAALVECFGEEILRGVVVLATKGDECSAKMKSRRVPAIKEAAAEHGIHEVVLWQNEGLDELGIMEQLEELQAALRRVPPIGTAELRHLDGRVQTRAKALCARAPPKTQTATRLVVDEYVEPREHLEDYWEEYVEWETIEVERRRLEPYVQYVKRAERYSYRVPAPFAVQLLTLGFASDETRYGTRTVTHKVTRHRLVSYTDTESVPVQRTRKAQRWVTTYDKKTRMKEVSVDVTIPRAVEEFLAEAREQVVSEVRATFRPV